MQYVRPLTPLLRRFKNSRPQAGDISQWYRACLACGRAPSMWEGVSSIHKMAKEGEIQLLCVTSKWMPSNWKIVLQ